MITAREGHAAELRALMDAMRADGHPMPFLDIRLIATTPTTDITSAHGKLSWNSQTGSYVWEPRTVNYSGEPAAEPHRCSREHGWPCNAVAAARDGRQ